jgi:hypothetical protein
MSVKFLTYGLQKTNGMYLVERKDEDEVRLGGGDKGSSRRIRISCEKIVP